ncbi:type II toxin-antitoxin system death-on-curing family toxin [Patescibacteria group bacterium]|nr:type II toxin-antitoxin system death-on-curing family toxin [Patescibacteria group bacterium]
MNYLTISQLLLIHSIIIDETTGGHGVHKPNILSGIILAPQQAVFGKGLYPTIFLKAALYARDIAMNHPFMDGNKRTAMVAALVFIENNGYVFEAEKGEIEHFALQIVIKKLSIEDIATWFEIHSKAS